MLELGRLISGLVHLFEPPGRWMFVKIVVLFFCATAIGRLVPWRPRRSVTKKPRRAIMGLWGVAAVALIAGLTGTAVLVTKAEGQFTAYQNRPAHATLPTGVSSYLGVYEPGTPFSYEPLREFTAATHTQPTVDLYYSPWGMPFHSAFAATAEVHGALTLVQMMPSGRGVSLTAIAAGKFNRYLSRFAVAVRTFRQAIIIGFGPEMNGNWYSWGYTRSKPAAWVAAWRHVVNVFRANGADNVTWLWVPNEIYQDSGPLTQYWPGKNYVTWVGIDAYFVPADHSFSHVIGPTLAQVRRITDKPVIISETGIAPEVGKAATLPKLFAGVRTDRLLGFIYFDGNQREDGFNHFGWRLEDSQAAVAQYYLLARQDASMPHPPVTDSP